MALISVKNLVHNKLARQNILFALLIQFWFLLFRLTLIIIYILILIIITIDFIVLLLLLYLIFVAVIIIIVLSIINVIYFVLSHLISYYSHYYDFCLRVACDVYVSLFSHYRLYHHCHHHNHFIFFNTTSHWGRIQQLNSSGMVYPYPLITLGKPQGKYYFYFYFYFILFFL